MGARERGSGEWKFARVPAEVWTKLSKLGKNRATVVFIAMCRYGGTSYQSRAALAKCTGFSVKTVGRAIEDLEDAGLIHPAGTSPKHSQVVAYRLAGWPNQGQQVSSVAESNQGQQLSGNQGQQVSSDQGQQVSHDENKTTVRDERTRPRDPLVGEEATMAALLERHGREDTFKAIRGALRDEFWNGAKAGDPVLRLAVLQKPRQVDSLAKLGDLTAGDEPPSAIVPPSEGLPDGCPLPSGMLWSRRADGPVSKDEFDPLSKEEKREAATAGKAEQGRLRQWEIDRGLAIWAEVKAALGRRRTTP